VASSLGTSRRERPLGAAVGVIAWRAGWCNEEAAQAWREMGVAAYLMSPPQALRRLVRGDVALNRLDVTPDLAGVEPGLADVERLRQEGIRVLNRAHVMAATHDKLETARLLERAAIPQPQTAVVLPGSRALPLSPPLVLKPRFGSWGRDVLRCATDRELAAGLAWVRGRSWFHPHGAIIQEYLPHDTDLRLVVAAGRVIGAIERRPAPGEWRTNFSLGGSRRPVLPPADAVEVACAAARALDVDLAGVDLIARPAGYVVVEVNGAVDFDRLYSLPGRDAYEDAATALAFPLTWHLPSRLHHRCGWTHAVPRTRTLPVV
jgi:RimK family alpha-L-glutamate ligase